MPDGLVKFLELIHHPVRSRLFLLRYLPSAFFSGVRITYADMDKAIVTVPYKWFTRNPFGSIYFACQAMAAEMSTGVLAMAYTFRSEPRISLLVIKLEASYQKKASGRIIFTCEEGNLISLAVNEAMATGKSTQATVRSVGKNESGETVSEFSITWSFMAKGGDPKK